MAKVFTTKEAKALIAVHKSLLKSLTEVAGISATIPGDIQQTDRILSSHIDNLISQDLEYHINTAMRFPGTEQLISSLYVYQKTFSLVASAKQLLEIHKSKIQSAVMQLTPGTSRIQWIFSGSKAKKNSEEAYKLLQELSCGSYASTIQSIQEEIAAIRKTPVDQIWDHFSENLAFYQNLYRQLTGSVAQRRVIPPFMGILDKQDDLEKKIAGCEASAEKDKKQIETAALKLAATEALAILQDVPIEEINRERSGIRVKTLREHGISTMADAYAASTYQLASIHGISEDAAYTIKGAAQEFAERAKTNAKIRLSADKRTKDSTTLILAIYGYKNRNAKRQELQDLVAGEKRYIESQNQVLQQLGNGIEWLFFTDSQKDTIRKAYQNLKDLLDGEYSWKLSKLVSALSNPHGSNSSDAWRDFERNSIAYLTILEEIVPGILGNDDSLYGLPEDLAREIQEEAFFPEGLLCTLRRYQEWGVKYILHQERVLLGDEMGLGKTVQAIAAMVSLRNTGATHFVVVCPASVVSNWCREITKHSKLRATKVHGSGRMQALRSWMKTGGVAVTTYETTGHFKLEDPFRFDMLIVDEAHYIKNPEARRTINVKRLCSYTKRLLFMTGTALENRVDEMIALIGILQPSIASSVRSMAFMSAAPQFRENVAPVYYRRKREDVLTELPELIEAKEWCTLNAEEEQVYEQTVLSRNYAAVRRVSWNLGDLKYSSKATRLLELIEEAAEENRKVLVFSFFLDTIRGIGQMLGERCYGPINGSVPPQRRQEIIDEFDKAPSGSVLLAQIQSGGTGLNIQSASVVIICEPQFKPSIENQAISRAYRMGQARNVLVYRLLCEDTVDEHITDILEQKQAIFDAFADKSVAAEQSLELDEKRFSQIIQEEIDRINAKKNGNPIKNGTNRQ